MKKIRIELVVLMVMFFGLSGIWIGCQSRNNKINEDKSEEIEQFDKAAVEFLKAVELKTTNTFSPPTRIDMSKAKMYTDTFRSYVKQASSQPKIAEQLFKILAKSESWRIDLDKLQNIWKGKSNVKYLYFYPAINPSDSTFTLVAVGAERYKYSSTMDSVRLVLDKSFLPAGSPPSAALAEIWDNMSPCPKYCPTNTFQ